MIQPSLFALLNILIVAVSLILLTWAWPYRRKAEAAWLCVLTFSLMLIALCTLNVYIQNSPEGMETFSRLRFLGFAWLAPSWLIFLTRSFGGWNFLRHRAVLIALMIPPSVTTILTLVPRWNDLMVHQFSPVTYGTMDLVQFQSGPWFSVHFLFSTTLVLLSMIYGLTRLPTLSRPQQRQMLLLLSGALSGLLIDVYCVATNSALRWAMVSGGAYLITEGTIFYSILKQSLLDIAPLAKEKIFREIPDPVLVVDNRETLQDFNSSAKELFGLEQKDLFRPWNSLQTGLDISQNGVQLEWRLAHEAMPARYFSVSIENLDRRALRPGKILFFREITTQKSIESKLNNHLEFKARLLSMIAHDFSGFLSTQGTLSSSLEKQVQPELRPRAGALADSVFASKDFMTNIVHWARTQESRFEPLKRPFEVNSLIQSVINSQEATLELHDLTVDFRSEKKPLILEGDGVMIESVVRNLLSNSIRASAPQSKISIHLTLNDSTVLIEVQDRGSGMTPAQLNSIREATGPLGPALRSEREGFGLGLLIARHFLELHGGRFEIDSEVGHGTSVTFSLPL